eukprot:TRINITY_DN7020_c0_g1_i7.p1 TRINITY_DN7020_c0_g1~~TRINITY_DN7020_c0_g1_i7.p1  ORF type:complete len:351 (+),score=62.10 TRINITY_DN7020_c0_g1_i7:222-1274(+)
MSSFECEELPQEKLLSSDTKRLSKEDRAKWTLEQDARLTGLAVNYGAKNWNTIASCMNETFPLNQKTSKQCRERWHYCLDMKINHKPWSKDEEAVLLIAHMDYGNKWCEIATRFNGRHNNMIKNRFYSVLRKVKNKIRNSDYSSQDQLELLEMHYMTDVMANYINHPAPAEDYKRKRGRDFMYTLVSDITIATLEKYSQNLTIFAPVGGSLRSLLEKIVESSRDKGKARMSPVLMSSCSKISADIQTISSNPQVTLKHILEFCWGEKGKLFILPEPPSFTNKESFNLEERGSLSKELFPPKLPSISLPLKSFTMTEHLCSFLAKNALITKLLLIINLLPLLIIRIIKVDP